MGAMHVRVILQHWEIMIHNFLKKLSENWGSNGSMALYLPNYVQPVYSEVGPLQQSLHFSQTFFFCSYVFNLINYFPFLLLITLMNKRLIITLEGRLKYLFFIYGKQN